MASVQKTAPRRNGTRSDRPRVEVAEPRVEVVEPSNGHEEPTMIVLRSHGREHLPNRVFHTAMEGHCFRVYEGRGLRVDDVVSYLGWSVRPDSQAMDEVIFEGTRVCGVVHRHAAGEGWHATVFDEQGVPRLWEDAEEGPHVAAPAPAAEAPPLPRRQLGDDLVARVPDPNAPPLPAGRRLARRIDRPAPPLLRQVLTVASPSSPDVMVDVELMILDDDAEGLAEWPLSVDLRAAGWSVHQVSPLAIATRIIGG